MSNAKWQYHPKLKKWSLGNDKFVVLIDRIDEVGVQPPCEKDPTDILREIYAKHHDDDFQTNGQHENT